MHLEEREGNRVTHPIGRLCDAGARHGADVTVRPIGRGLACVYECPECGRTLAETHVADDDRIMFDHRTRMRSTRIACAIIGLTLGKEHECVTRSSQSHAERSPS